MSRLLFEFEDFHWFPDTIRESMTDYLRYFFKTTNFYKPSISLLNDVMGTTGEVSIIDLCSGSGGPIESILLGLENMGMINANITLTDKFPNINAFKLLNQKYPENVHFRSESIDVSSVPNDLKGFRTIFSGIHHFDEKTIGEIINNAVQNKAGIGIFDGGDKNIFIALGIILLQPLSFFFMTPFFRPFRISRLIFTYLIPIIPFCTAVDGVVSIMRLYTPKQLEQIARLNDDGKYTWKSGKVRNSFRMNVTYLIGHPIVK